MSYTYAKKLTGDYVIAPPFLLLSVVIVTLPLNTRTQTSCIDRCMKFRRTLCSFVEITGRIETTFRNCSVLRSWQDQTSRCGWIRSRAQGVRLLIRGRRDPQRGSERNPRRQMVSTNLNIQNCLSQQRPCKEYPPQVSPDNDLHSRLKTCDFLVRRS